MSQTILETIVKITGDITGLKTSLDNATNETNKAIDNVENRSNSMSSKVGGTFSKMGSFLATSVAGAAAAAVASLGAIAVAGAKSALDMATSYENGLNKLKATTGASAEEVKKYGEVIKNVYGNNFGASMDEVADSVAQVGQQLKGLKPDEIQSITENAYRLKDAFGTEVAESVSAAKTLMDKMGMSSQEAFDFIAKGYQDGLDASGDFLDTINEYGVQFQNSGFKAEEFYSVIKSGQQAGVLGLDKAADLVKEFGLRIADGSKGTGEALASLGIDAEKLAEKLGSGKLSKGEAFTLINNKLKEVKDTTERANIGIALMGTQYEDLGQKAVEGISTTLVKQKEMEGSTKKIDAMYQNFSSMFTGAWRQIQLALLPAGQEILKVGKEYMPVVIKGITDVAKAIPGIISWFKKVGTEASPYIKALSPLFNTLKDVVVTAFTAIAAIWNSVLKPVFTFIGPYVKAAFGVAIGAINLILSVVKGVFGAIGKIFKGDFKGALDSFVSAVSKGVAGANAIFSKFSVDAYKAIASLIPRVKQFGVDVVNGLIGGIKSNINRAINAAGELGAGFLKGFRERLGIKSPSREMAKNGKDIIDGLDIGLDPNKAKELGKRTGDNVAKGLNASVAKYALEKLNKDMTLAFKDGASQEEINKFSDKFAAMTSKIKKAGLDVNPVLSKISKDIKSALNLAGIAGGDKVELPKLDLGEFTTDLNRAIRDFNLLKKQGKLTEEQVISFSDKLEDMGNKAQKAGVRNNTVVSGLFTQAKALVTAGKEQVAHNQATEKANKLTKDREDSLNNLRSVLGSMTVAQLKNKLALDDGTDAQRRAIIQKALDAKVTEENTKAQKERKAALANLKSAVKDMTLAELENKLSKESGNDADRKAIIQGAISAKQKEAQKEAEKKVAEAIKATNILLKDRKKVEAELNAQNKIDTLQGSYDDALSAAGDNLEAQLEAAKTYEPKLVAAKKNLLEAQRKAENEFISEGFNIQIEANKKLGLSTANLEAAKNNAISANNEKYRIRNEEAERDSSKKIAEYQERLNKDLADKKDKQAKENLEKDKKRYMKEFEDLNGIAIESLSELTNSHLINLQLSLDEQLEKYKALGEAGEDVVAKIGSVSDSVAQAVTKNMKNAQDFFKTFSDEAAKTVANIKGDLGISGETEEQQYVAKGLSSADGGISTLQKQILDARNSVPNLDEADRANALAEIDSWVTELLTLMEQRNNKADKLAAEFWQNEDDKAHNTIDSIAKNNLELGNITQKEYTRQLEASKAYWTERLGQVEAGTEEYLSIQNKIISLSGDIDKSIGSQVQEQIDTLGDLTSPENYEANVAFLDNLLKQYDKNSDAYKNIKKAIEDVDKAHKDRTKDEEDAAKDLDDALDKSLDKLDERNKKVKEFNSKLDTLFDNGRKEDAQLVIDSLETQKDTELALAKTEEEKARISLKWSGQILEAKKELVKIEEEIALAVNERARTEALADEANLGQAERINAIYDAEAKRIKANNKLKVDALNTTTNTENQASEAVLKGADKTVNAIAKYADYAKQAIGLLTQGLVLFGGMSEEVAAQWGEDLNSMVNDIVSIGTAIAKGDWVSAAIGALTTIFNWFGRNKKAAEEARKATEEFQKQFKFTSGDQFRKVETYTTGILFWQTTHYKESLDELGVEITKILDSGIGNGLSSGIQNYLNGTGGIAEAIYDSLRSAIVNAITQAVIESAIIKEKLGPILEELAYAIRNNLDPTQVLTKLKTAIPEVVTSLENTLSPIKEALDEVWPSIEKSADKAIDKVAEFVQKLAEGIKSGVDGGFKSGMQKFLEGGTIVDMFEGIKAGIKSAIVNAVLEAVMNGAIIQGALGGMLKQLTEALANGTDPTAIINAIASALPSIVSTLEQVLAPIKNALKVLDPVVAAPVPSAPEMSTPMSTSSNASSGVSGSVATNNTVNNNVDLKFYITEAQDAEKIAREVERKITRNMLRA